MIYHGVFTSFQCHDPISVEALNKAKEVIFDIKLLKVTRQNNNHVVKENQMVASWTKSKPVLQNALPKLQDDNVGEDSLSYQSIFDQDINSDGYLNSLVPRECFLTIKSHAFVMCKKKLYQTPLSLSRKKNCIKGYNSLFSITLGIVIPNSSNHCTCQRVFIMYS